jgi:hypothetical protein
MYMWSYVTVFFSETKEFLLEVYSQIFLEFVLNIHVNMNSIL